MKNKSVFENNLKNEFPNLEEDITCDLLIIGGGIAGILSSFYLKDSNLNIVLVERNTLLSGITSKMTAKVTLLEDTLTKISNDKLNLYLKSKLDGLKLLKDNINNLNIECDFYKNDSYLYTTKKSNIKKLKKIETTLSNLKINFSNDNIPVSELDSLYSIKISNSYEINPIKYLNEIINNLTNINIFENTNIIKVIKEKNSFISYTSNNKKIISKKIIFATNYPYFLKPLLFPLKVRLEKSYIIYGNSNYHGHYNLINIDKNINSIRFYQEKMIYLSNNKYLSHVNNYKDYNSILNNNLILNPINIWTNMDIITNDYLPIVGSVFKDMYIITGFNTWGILSSHIGASLISSLVMKKRKYLKYKSLFDPRRKTNFKKIINSSINIYENLNGYFKGMISKDKLVYYSKDKALYIDKNKSYIVKRKCPHLKCNLIFNSKELTWDCPCHGSRFSLSGDIILGPSKYDIK